MQEAQQRRHPAIQICNILYRYVMDCVEPGLEYFADTVSGTLGNSMAVFKAANPQKPVEVQPDAAALDCFSFLDTATLQNLKTELPIHLTKAADISPDYDVGFTLCPAS